HEESLWTGPSTKQPSIDHREEHHEYDHGDHRYGKYEEVVRPKYFTKECKSSLQNIELYELDTMYMYQWHREKNNQVEVGQVIPPFIQFTLRLSGKNPITLTFFSDCTDTSTKTVFFF